MEKKVKFEECLGEAYRYGQSFPCKLQEWDPSKQREWELMQPLIDRNTFTIRDFPFAFERVSDIL